MIIAEINTGFRGSTGGIMLNTASLARQNGHNVVTFSAYKKEVPPKGHEYIGSKCSSLLNRVRSVFTGISEKGSKKATKNLIKRLTELNVDVLHLHNLHGWYLNVPMLFEYIKSNNVKVIWTLHDCWGFTAQCSHFEYEGCQKWKTGCYECPRYKIYPYTYVDKTKKMWKLKKEWFAGINDLTIVTPSKWLADNVKQSFLKDYPVKVINNGIDLDVFKPTESDFRKNYSLENKKIVLGVASNWTKRKGLDVFVKLSQCLTSDYQIVLVGTNDNVDKQLPSNIISIHRTNNQRELAEIYTACDVYANPTREEVLGLVNIESLACGTPVVTFNAGGSPECVNEDCGSVVEIDDIDAMEREIVRICQDKPFAKEACFDKAREFDKNLKFKEYVELYLA
ncbi:MAG: glycosyltransferase [Clostridia bacterium]|nr:glycosyltransferase [Clostridia bacterium]